MSEGEVKSNLSGSWVEARDVKTPTLPWEWASLRTDYTIDGCSFLMLFEGRHDFLFAVHLWYTGTDDLSRCRDLLRSRIEATFHERQSNSSISAWLWNSGVTGVYLQPFQLTVVLSDSGQ